MVHAVTMEIFVVYPVMVRKSKTQNFSIYFWGPSYGGGMACDVVVVAVTTVCSTSADHHENCEFEAPS